MRSKFFLILLLFAIQSRSQNVINVNNAATGDNPFRNMSVGGNLIKSDKYIKVVEGTPFFNDNYLPGTLTVLHGRHYGSIQLKLNLLDNEVYYLNDKGQELLATTPLSNITITNNTVGITFQFDYFPRPEPGYNNLPWGWMELLETGKQITLYKKHTKELAELKPYGSATYEQRIATVYAYFVVYQKQMHAIKSFEDLIALMPSQSADLQNFIKQNKLKFKQEKDIERLTIFINDGN